MKSNYLFKWSFLGGVWGTSFGDGDLPKGGGTPWSYLVKWVTRGRGEGGVKNLKKWVTSFTDSPIVYGMNIFPFYMSNCQIVKIVRKYILLLVPLPSRNLSKFSWLIALWKLLLLLPSCFHWPPPPIHDLFWAHDERSNHKTLNSFSL